MTQLMKAHYGITKTMSTPTTSELKKGDDLVPPQFYMLRGFD